ncbi:helix-turn-helix transcriptional regulator [Paenibacillus alvei]|uniref:helix-turn-helix domain-containing protein n=1 Tax=Paenibacillus alvei TaxID=44250 RepID=UPI0021D393D5|nr:helix-turn-helix transcriptional regulator [Paenibacillus alvei]MCY9705799.1 helix-turn-helix transcriptional regulator [Paenibacillus alvei]MCY9737116.1 helix-turn-helix transcriptional regulator [Paenibacillus alvei]MCY9753506.1 helix-turn-helix transcriptional regulator [Paenibacillus alvei]MCY9767837.1 helix-turn-helix transcriptional regulator [Paenibacillus alvei]
MPIKKSTDRVYLKQLREAKGTQRLVAGDLKITESHLRGIESGSSYPSTKLLFRISNYLGASVYELFPELNEPSFYSSDSN